MLKIPECVMHNHVDKCFFENKSTDLKQFGFQVGHSTDPAITQLENQIFEVLKIICIHRTDHMIWYNMIWYLIIWYRSKEPHLHKKLSVKQETIF